ncbi:MAG: class I SAM-dependent methyltransferase [candidate division KSB1 bacterium]|nr:class I SAM-dependent methyltransferase [candidate division KSB1 bacterium]MDZ7365862.1 class I SAM-dependent methyltransferase [candidate division KSB1 bacterium]MDZ7403903.1 class I SAM-dependent methyltransferase [candidate division KSB1 bacterium]
MPHSVLSTSTAFDEVAINYDAAESCNRIFQWMRRRVQSAAASTFDRGARLLEIGCGTGTDALFFARRGHDIVAVEPSPGMLAVANEKIAEAGFSNNVAFWPGGVESTKELIQHHGAACKLFITRAGSWRQAFPLFLKLKSNLRWDYSCRRRICTPSRDIKKALLFF